MLEISFDDLMLVYDSIKSLERAHGGGSGAIAFLKAENVTPEFAEGARLFIKLLEDFYAIKAKS